jgi:uncharacterized protein (DUF736 family)
LPVRIGGCQLSPRLKSRPSVAASHGLIWAGIGWRLDRLGRNGGAELSSPGLRPFLASQESPAPPSSARAAGRKGCAGGRPGPDDRHRGRDGRGLESQRRTDMATIGTFKKSGSEYAGEIVTLSVQAKNVRIVPEEGSTSENAPSHRVFVGRAEIGAAWSKRSNEGRDYLSLKLDDPSFTAPIYANLFDDASAESEDSYSLIWSRPSRRSGD